MPKGKIWSEKEVSTLRENAPNMTIPELSKLMGRSQKSIAYRIWILKIRTKGYVPFRHINKDFFKVWTPEMAYVFGYWFADGNISCVNQRYRFRISSNDLEQLEKIKVLMSSNHKIHHRKDTRKYRDRNHMFNVSCKEIYDDIVKLGGTERKSLIAKFPYVPDVYVSHFIRGFYDGDGGIFLRDYNAPTISFIGTREFLEEMMKRLPYKAKFYTHFKMSVINYAFEYARDVLDYMYKDSTIHLDRKFKLYEKSKSWRRQFPLKESGILYKLNGYPIHYDYKGVICE